MSETVFRAQGGWPVKHFPITPAWFGASSSAGSRRRGVSFEIAPRTLAPSASQVAESRGPAGSCSPDGPRRLGALQGEEIAASTSRRCAACAAHADHLPGPLRLAQPAHDRWARSASRHVRDRDPPSRAARVRELLEVCRPAARHQRYPTSSPAARASASHRPPLRSIRPDRVRRAVSRSTSRSSAIVNLLQTCSALGSATVHRPRPRRG